MQWLRHTRFEPPTIQEQQQELQRQANIKLLAARADARWAAKPSALDAPDKQQPIQMLESRDPKSDVIRMNAEQEPKTIGSESRSAEVMDEKKEMPMHDTRQDVTTNAKAPQPIGATDEVLAFKAKKRMRVRKESKEESPWKQAGTGNPGDDWQPKAWMPPPKKRG